MIEKPRGAEEAHISPKTNNPICFCGLSNGHHSSLGSRTFECAKCLPAHSLPYVLGGGQAMCPQWYRQGNWGSHGQLGYEQPHTCLLEGEL